MFHEMNGSTRILKFLGVTRLKDDFLKHASWIELHPTVSIQHSPAARLAPDSMRQLSDKLRHLSGKSTDTVEKTHLVLVDGATPHVLDCFGLSWPLTKPLNMGVVNFLLSPQVY